MKKLTDKEYFTLEAHAYEVQLEEQKKEILALKANIKQKDLIIQRYIVGDIQREINSCREDVSRCEVKIMNINKAKKEVVAKITKKYKLKEGWGYDPATLEIK